MLGVASYENVLHDSFAQAMQHAVRSLKTLLFIGFGKGLEDPNFSALLSWARQTFKDSVYRHYRLSLESEVAEVQATHEPTDKIFVLGYGDNRSDLPEYLRSLQPSPHAITNIAPLASAIVAPATTALYAPPGGDFEEYISAVRAAHGSIRFVELPTYDDTPDIDIAALFVEPQLSVDHILPERPESEWGSLTTLDEVLSESHKVVLLGDPGYGKSTLISRLALQACVSRNVIPIPMVVRELKLKADITWEGLLDAFLEHRIGKFLRSRSALESILKDGNAIVFLDGLDEIANLTVRRKLRDAVHEGIRQYTNVKWIMTSRAVGYDQVPFHLSVDHVPISPQKRKRKAVEKKDSIADVFYLAPFATPQIKAFAEKWYGRHEADVLKAEEQAAAFVADISNNSGTTKLARVPYLLTLMALIHRKSVTLPHGRTDLYERIAKAYLESIDIKRELDQGPYSLQQKQRWLADVAFQMQLRRAKKPTSDPANGGDMLVQRAEVCKWLSKAMAESGADCPDEEANSVLDYFASRSGLLAPRGEGLFAFMHLSLQEYFAAYYLELRLTASRFSKAPRNVPTDKQLLAWADEQQWLEVYVLVFELLAKKESSETEAFFEFLYATRFDGDSAGENAIAVRLLADIVTDPVVILKASTRSQGRQMAWKWLFAASARRTSASRATPNAVAQLLLAEHKGCLKKAWESAGMSDRQLRDTVTSLDLTGCSMVTDLRPLATLSKLEYLSIDGCHKITDLSPIKHNDALLVLDLRRCAEIRDLSPITACKDLQTIRLGGCYGLESYLPLSAFSNVRYIHLPDCKGFDALSPLSTLLKLNSLVIDELRVPINFAYLLKNTALQVLTIQRSEVPQDLSPLKTHPSIGEIHLHNVPSDLDVTPLESTPNLKLLCLGGNRVDRMPESLIERGIVSPPYGDRARRAPVSRAKEANKDL